MEWNNNPIIKKTAVSAVFYQFFLHSIVLLSPLFDEPDEVGSYSPPAVAGILIAVYPSGHLHDVA